MPIVVRLDVMLARRKAKSKDLAAHIGITATYTYGRIQAVRFRQFKQPVQVRQVAPIQAIKTIYAYRGVVITEPPEPVRALADG